MLLRRRDIKEIIKEIRDEGRVAEDEYNVNIRYSN